MIPVEISQYLTSWLQQEFSASTKITSFIPTGGGSINETFRIKTNTGDFFIKYNQAKRYPGMFSAESNGLSILKKADCIEVPGVLHCAGTGNFEFLILDYIPGTKPVTNFWQIFGQNLACLHRHTSSYFGLDHDNYIGSLKQSNNNHDSWATFLIAERFQPLIKMACEKGLLDGHDMRKAEILFNKLPQILPVEPPSLIHGDLWSGNFMSGVNGNPVIFDPAVYYGHRETDIAMTRLFGGFEPAFYDSYNNSWPLEPGWQERIKLNQLYPLLVHVNLFGAGYSRQVRQILADYQ